jgi:arylsulfatase A-like enzyme
MRSRPRPPVRRPTAALLLALGLLAGGCGRSGEDTRLDLRSRVAAGQFQVEGEPPSPHGSLVFRRRPELIAVEVDHEKRPAVLAAAGTWSWRGRIPEGAKLVAGAQLLPAAWRGVEGLEVVVTARDGDRREVLDVARVRRKEGADGAGTMHWLDLGADLAAWAGREVTLEFSADLAGLPASHRDANLVAWGPVAVFPPAPPEKQPNILFLLVDTLRHDRLTPYGYARDTSPEIARRLAGPGVVVEEAYSQAPWTLPSVVSFLTGRSPGELLGRDLASYGIPAEVETLAERLAKLGYRTGGFFANPTLHAGAGFGQGFETLFTPPADIEWIRKHADELNRHAVPWIAAHQAGDRPFFAYVHYVDPHDPYDNPDVVDGRTPFDPDYKGPVRGEWVHGVYTGRIELRRPLRDAAHLSALYDTEVRYVDRHIGALLATIPPEVLANTLVVLTADHGEELFDHGGWKHGQTLYEEQIHVPLIFRWDRRLPAGTRLAGTVRLLDLMPTLMHAAGGGAADPAWDGIDLLPALAGEAPLPKRPAFAQHLAGGPLRAAAVLGREKLIFFNREVPFETFDAQQAHLWEVDHGRMARVELYDLARDPRERQNLAPTQPERVGRMAPLIHAPLDRALPGLRVLTQGLPAGARLSGSMRFARPPAGTIAYFAGPADRVELSGTVVRFELAGEPLDKGFLVEGDFGQVEAAELALDGVPLPPNRILVGRGAPYGGGAVPFASLLADVWPVRSGVTTPALRVWAHRFATLTQGARTGGADPETEQRLRALGYIK